MRKPDNEINPRDVSYLGEDLLAELTLLWGGVLLVVGALEDLELIRGHGSSDGNEGRNGEDDLHHGWRKGAIAS